MLSVTILGNNSALPAHNRHPTSQVVQTSEHTFLIDCGEGTQMQMSSYKIKKSKITHIFISHLHGDHYFGLIGLLTSFGLNDRTTDLHIFSSSPLKRIVDIQLQAADTKLPYIIHFHDLEKEAIIFEDKKISIECFRVHHRIECWGFLFKEKRNPRRIDAEKMKDYRIPPSFYESLQQGKDFITDKNEIIKNELLTNAGAPCKSYAFAADTAYFEQIIKKIRNADLLYHESTYLKDLEEKATKRFHSTSVQAASIAKQACVKKLLLGHFSSMYENIEEFKNEAQQVFENTELAEEGTCYIV